MIRLRLMKFHLTKEAPVYFLFYKPRGVISAVSDDKNRKVVTDYFPHIQRTNLSSWSSGL